jgi:uncharacterized protein (TIGR00730 family)
MERLAVFCGSSYGTSEAYREGARQLGQEMAERGIALVYGGSSVGLMGVVADSVLEHGGKAIGVLPKLLEEREISHKHLTELHIVETMHERKAKMAELADGFIALPGGAGTLEEFFEIFTWAQIGLHEKPCGLLNINNFYNPLVHLLSHMAGEGFLQEKYLSLAIVDSNPKSLIDQFYTYQSPGIKNFTK